MTQRRILATEDDPALQDLLADLLGGEGYELAFAPRPDPAKLARLAPDLLLLDWWDGGTGASAAALDRLRADPATAGLPVVVLTAATDEAAARAAYFAGHGVRVVTKPFGIGDLLAVVEGALGGRGGPG